MKIRRVLVVFRKSLYQIYVKEHNDRTFKQALRLRDSTALVLRESHEAQTAALASIHRTLHHLGIDAVYSWRARIRSTRHSDLVISVGGDGTLLDTSRRILDATPLLGINSDPTRSVGALCCGQAEDLEERLDALASRRLRPRPTTRLRIRIDGQEVLGPILNDVLYAHCSPAGLTRFDLAILPAEDLGRAHRDPIPFQHFRGSGLWISTATGSSAAIHSAGGAILPAASKQLQFLVREPYRRPDADRPHGLKGRVRPGEALLLVPRVRQSAVWADGPHRSLALKYCQQVVNDRHPRDLLLVRLPG